MLENGEAGVSSCSTKMQRRFLQIAGVADKLSQPRGLIFNFPQWFPSPHVSFLGSRKSISQLDNLTIP